MNSCFVSNVSGKAIPIVPIAHDDFANWITTQPCRIKNLTSSNSFLAEPNSYCLLTDHEGKLEKVLLGIAKKEDFFAFGILPKLLPEGCYEIIAPEFSLVEFEHAAIGWGMGSYQFKQYKEIKEYGAKLLCQDNNNIVKINRIISATFFVRDLINLPAGDLYPEKLAAVATDLANEFTAEIRVVKGEELITDFPAVHAVGKGSEKPPVLIDLRYGDLNAPKVVLIGKGVCFDSGGLQIKPSGSMALMKRDMAGAAHALALARMIMEAKLPINLRVIIPAVENLVSGNSLKPGDIIKTRKGITLEIMHTDAEGRLILADALALASSWQPEMILDFATLTGAARVALGPEVTALFANDQQLAQEIMVSMSKEQEAVWQLPLYQPYLEFLKSEVADFKNIATNEHAGAGAILAALLLEQFVDPKILWAHFDIEAYNAVTRPARPEGGEAVCLRGLFNYLEERFTR